MVGFSVNVEDFSNECVSFLLVGVSGVTFLPEELSSTDERSRVLEFPSHDVGPLVNEHGQVSVRVDPLGIGGVHDSLGSRSDSDGFLHLTLTRLGDPSDFRGEAFNVLLFFVEGSFSDEHGEVSVLDTESLESRVHEALNLFPDEVRTGSEDVASRDIVVLNQVRLSDHLLVPLREVLLFRVLNSFVMASFNLFSFSNGLRLDLLLFSRFLRFGRLWLLSSSASSHLNEVHNLNLVLTGIDNLLNVFFLEGSGSGVDHRVESN